MQDNQVVKIYNIIINLTSHQIDNEIIILR